MNKRAFHLSFLPLLVLGVSSCGARPESSSLPSSSSSSSTPLLGKKIKITCPEEALSLTKKMVSDYFTSNPSLGQSGYSYSVQANPGDADFIRNKSNVPDLFFFAQDQLQYLFKTDTLSPLSGTTADWSKSALEAASWNGTLYSYPAAIHNGGCFLYYDASKVSESDASDWEALLELAQTNDYEIEFDCLHPWYFAGFFFATGCHNEWLIDSSYRYIGYEDDFASDKGVVSVKALAKIMLSPVVKSSGASNAVALVGGTWNYNDLLAKWGENLKCAELPHFTIDGTRYHTGSYSGYQLLGVKAQNDAKKVQICHDLAAYLSSQEAQMERFEGLKWIPCEKNAMASEAVASNQPVSALLKQNEYAHPQGSIPTDWWDFACREIGNGIHNLSETPTDQEIRSMLDQYKNGLASLLEK